MGFRRFPDSARRAFPHTTGRCRPSCSQGLQDPWAQFVGALQTIGGKFVVAHCAPCLTEGPKRLHPKPLEIRTIGLIHLQVNAVFGNQAENDTFGVDARAPEHGADLHRKYPAHLVCHVVAEPGIDRHRYGRLIQNGERLRTQGSGWRPKRECATLGNPSCGLWCGPTRTRPHPM